MQSTYQSAFEESTNDDVKDNELSRQLERRRQRQDYNRKHKIVKLFKKSVLPGLKLDDVTIYVTNKCKDKRICTSVPDDPNDPGALEVDSFTNHIGFGELLITFIENMVRKGYYTK
eukprot:280478_1